MGDYNPHAPKIVGNEWVPIRDEDLVFSPNVNAFEVGHEFSVPGAAIADARFYLNEFPPDQIRYRVMCVGIYPIGNENNSGPIQRIVIPCNNGGVTGASILDAVSVGQALYNPSDEGMIEFVATLGGVDKLTMFFALNQYPILNGKRILGLNLLYAADLVGLGSGEPLTTGEGLRASITNDAGVGRTFGFLNLNAAAGVNTDVSRKRFGEVNPVFGGPPSPNADRHSWRYSDLQRFEATNASRLMVRVETVLTDAQTILTASLRYAALEVIYCEETRVGIAMASFGDGLTAGSAEKALNFGANVMTMRNAAGSTVPTISSGDYVVVLSAPDIGAIDGSSSSFPSSLVYPTLNSVRELYELPTLLGVQINIPFLPEDHIGEIFTREPTHILPQISLHFSSGAPVTAVHTYGRQAQAQVWGTQTATQHIFDEAISPGGAPAFQAPFPLVRYYARRFGETTVPLILSSPDITGAGISVSLTPGEWDSLPEIVDGWKEITKEFPTAPTMGQVTGNPRWRWSSPGELVSSRWEVLASSAPALSGNFANPFNLVPSIQRLDEATYQPLSGASVLLNWMPQGIASPYVSGFSADPATDAVLLFSQSPVPITGIGIETLSQAVTGIGLDCQGVPCCVPSAITYNRITWPFPTGTSYARDSFNRVEVGGWGDADVGGFYNESDSADMSVNGTRGIITPSVGGSDRFATLPTGPNFDIMADLIVPNPVFATSEARPGLVGRFTDSANHHAARIEVSATGTVNLRVFRRQAGVVTTHFLDSLPFAAGNGSSITMRYIGQNTWFKVKVWPTGQMEPESWVVELNDGALPTGDEAGIYGRSEVLAGNVLMYDNLVIQPPDYWFEGYELQRSDDLTDWQTIMFATSPAVTAFNDYEARVGIEATYRIRNIGVLNFNGPWSNELTATIPAPGISGGSDCFDNGHVLIFTTNAIQQGSRNLAYAPIWDGTVIEDFGFPEAGQVALQAMYDRDFVTAFHPLERGGEQFSREILVQAAAIPPETLADFTDLRDLAWESVPYVCVRDEDGNRWFATIVVPTGRVRNLRRLYTARIDIIETTATAAPIDPTELPS